MQKSLLNPARFPQSATPQLDRLCLLLQETVPSLAGLILHGSAATSGFEANRSDLDLLAITDSPLTTTQLQILGAGILDISIDPHPLEFSVITNHDLANWSHPFPHQFHFSEDHREDFEAGEFAPQSSTDEDLAMHLTVAKARGLDLLGAFPVETLPDVPRRDFLAAIMSDFEWASQRDEVLDRYLFSNACRTLAYLKEGLVLSKTEGVEWCRDHGTDTTNIITDVEHAIQRELNS